MGVADCAGNSVAVLCITVIQTLEKKSSEKSRCNLKLRALLRDALVTHNVFGRVLSSALVSYGRAL